MLRRELDQARDMPRARLRFATLEPTDGEPSMRQVYTFQVETGRGTALPAKGDGTFELDELAPGFYRVVMIGAPFGQVEWGEPAQPKTRAFEIVSGGSVEITIE